MPDDDRAAGPANGRRDPGEREAMAEEGAPSFERDIRPLFREKDRARMEWAFDLWHLEDVKANARPILERLEEGDMPCDGAWAEEQIETFRRWMGEGMAP